MGAAGPKQKQPPPPRGCQCDAGEVCAWVLVSLMLLSLVSIFVVPLTMLIKDPPKYSVAIAAVSGLDCGDAPVAALNPEFNVTVRVTSRSRDKACLHPATSVQVSYLRVPLAGGRVRPSGGGGLCAPPWKHLDHAVVARGKAVAVLGFLTDSLAEDVRTGRPCSRSRTLMSPNERYWDVLTCWGKIGDAAAALEGSCATSSVDADLPVPPQSGRGQCELLVSARPI